LADVASIGSWTLVAKPVSRSGDVVPPEHVRRDGGEHGDERDEHGDGMDHLGLDRDGEESAYRSRESGSD
jgi:hypothetical protein